MATLIARLYDTGELRIAGEFNDWDATEISISPDQVGALELDEVTDINGVAQRVSGNGILHVSGFFNEVDPFVMIGGYLLTTVTESIIETEPDNLAIVTEI